MMEVRRFTNFGDQQSMKHTTMRFIAIAIISIIARPTLAQHPETAICSVCRVHEGETAPEKVAASSEYQGETHYFCSKKCKETFDSDPEAYLPPVLPRSAPNFTLANLAGEKIALENFRGKIVLLDFWATWCKPCVKSMPALQKVHDQFASKNFTALGVSIDEDGKEKVESFVKKHKIAYPILLDGDKNPAWETYKVKVIPMLFLVDPQGQIVQQWVGETDMKEVESAVAGLVAKRDKE
jgi:peroxiredoxin/YHS domain-containing protein